MAARQAPSTGRLPRPEIAARIDQDRTFRAIPRLDQSRCFDARQLGARCFVSALTAYGGAPSIICHHLLWKAFSSPPPDRSGQGIVADQGGAGHGIHCPPGAEKRCSAEAPGPASRRPKPPSVKLGALGVMLRMMKRAAATECPRIAFRKAAIRFSGFSGGAPTSGYAKGLRGVRIDRGRGPGDLAGAGYTHVLGDGTPAVQALNKFIPTRSPASTGRGRP
jgi:hypothetical protein